MLTEFQTVDVYTAAIIAVLLKILPTFKIKNQKVIFCYPASDDIYKVLNDFNSGIAVNSFEFVQMIKRFRAEMMVRRKMGHVEPVGGGK